MGKGKAPKKAKAKPKIQISSDLPFVDRGSPPAPGSALSEKLNYRSEGMVHGLNNVIFNFCLPPARTRDKIKADPHAKINEQCPKVTPARGIERTVLWTEHTTF